MSEAAKARAAVATAVHATAVAIGERGILIRGPSGAGKTALARALIEAGLRAGRFSRLIGDDRVLLEAQGGRLVVRPHAAIAGQMEIRGQGIVPAAHEPAAILRVVVDIAPEGAITARMPEKSSFSMDLAGIALPRLAVAAGRPAADAAADTIAFIDREMGTTGK